MLRRLVGMGYVIAVLAILPMQIQAQQGTANSELLHYLSSHSKFMGRIEGRRGYVDTFTVTVIVDGDEVTGSLGRSSQGWPGGPMKEAKVEGGEFFFTNSRGNMKITVSLEEGILMGDGSVNDGSGTIGFDFSMRP